MIPHDVSLIATIAVGFGLALIFGFIAARLRMPPLVGYLLAGIVIGPATPGFVANTHLAQQLAEIGVMLLMFGVGLHFSLEELMSVKRIAIPGAIVQILVAVLLGMLTAYCWGWNIGAACIFGLSLSVASTVVLLRTLETKGLLKSINGQIAMGWLVVEDLVMVFVLVLLPALANILSATSASDHAVTNSVSVNELWEIIGLTLIKVTSFIAFMLVIGRRVLPKALWYVARTGSQELFTLCIVAIAISVAFAAAKLFDVSFALGAFFSGMMMRESEFSHRAASESLPLRDAFSVLFFVSVGMLFDPSIIWAQPTKLLAVIAIIMVGKTIAAIVLVLLFRYPLNTALTVGASLAQIGEFSFILIGLGVTLNLIPIEGQSLVLAGALISIAANSTMFSTLDSFKNWGLKHSSFVKRLAKRPDPLARLPLSVSSEHVTHHVVIVGYGRVGKHICATLRDNGIAYVVIEQNREIVDTLREENIPAVSGDATSLEVLIQAHIPRASMFVVAIHDTIHLRKMITIAKELNPHLSIVIRTHDEEEAQLFSQENLGTVFLSEKELAHNMSAYIIQHLKASA